MKKIIALALSALLLIGAAVVGTVAFLTDTDQAVNVMTSGNIDIEQYEKQRDKNGDLVDFKNSDMFPAFTLTPNLDWNSTEATQTVAVNGQGYSFWNPEIVKNVKDNIVYVKNTGKNAAYVRTFFAFENPFGEKFAEKVVLNWSSAVTAKALGNETIDNTTYAIYVVTYEKAIAPGTFSAPSLLQFAFAETADNADMKAIDGSLEVLAFTQAVQTEGFSNEDDAAATALNRAFTSAHPWTDVTAIACVGTAAELSKAVSKGGVVVLTNDIVADADDTITVASGVKTTLLLNGHTISATSDVVGSNRNLFDVRGTMNVINGTIVFEHTGENMGWGSSTNIFNVTAGGVLNIENATLKNLGGSDMAFVAHLNNWGKVTLNVNNSTLVSSYVAVRVFNSGNDMNNVNITNSTLMGTSSSFWVHNYTEADFGTAEKVAAQAALLNFNFLAPTVDFENPSAANLNAAANNTFVGKIRYGFTDAVSPYKSTGVDNATDLAEKLEEGGNVILTENVKMESATAAPYGNKYAVKMDGGVLDGNGNELYMECYGDDYGVMTSGGTIKNLTITEGCRAIMIMYPKTDVILDNVKIGGDGVLYPINTGEGGAEGVNLIVTNSTLAGWTSFGLIESASFTNVKFEQGTYYNNIYGRVLKPYVNTTLTDCSFVEHMNLDLSSLAAGHKIVMKNCTVNGQAVTAEVFTIPTTDEQYDTELFTVDLPSWATSITDCIIFQ